LTIPSIVNDDRPLPPKAPAENEDELLFADDPWIDSPIKVDYGINLRYRHIQSHLRVEQSLMISCRIGTGVYINFNCTFLDTCLITIGSRTLIGPNCSFYSATHPLDPFLRNGISGPELGKPITIGEDCWFGGNVIVLPGITIGRGVTVGAGSVVTKDVPPFHCVAGNPARIIRKIEVNAPDPLLGSEIPKPV
jgi:acetyltransferase-like isoleucine patch superfamily enzyme